MANLYYYMVLIENPAYPGHYERFWPNFSQWGQVVETCRDISNNRPGGAGFLILRAYSEETLEAAYQRLLDGDTLEIVLNDYYAGIESLTTGAAEELAVKRPSPPTLRDMLGIRPETTQGVTLAEQMSRILKPTQPASPYKNGNPPETVPFVPERGSWMEWKWQREKVEVALNRIGGKYDGLPMPELPDR